MESKKLLRKIFARDGRASGRTEAMLNGLGAVKNVLVIAHSREFAEELKRRKPGISIATLDDIRSEKFTGTTPMFIPDHFVMEILFERLCAEYDKKIDSLRRSLVLENPKTTLGE